LTDYDGHLGDIRNRKFKRPDKLRTVVILDDLIRSRLEISAWDDGAIGENGGNALDGDPGVWENMNRSAVGLFEISGLYIKVDVLVKHHLPYSMPHRLTSSYGQQSNRDICEKQLHRERV
jgi:hypothetical protein